MCLSVFHGDFCKNEKKESPEVSGTLSDFQCLATQRTLAGSSPEVLHLSLFEPLMNSRAMRNNSLETI